MPAISFTIVRKIAALLEEKGKERKSIYIAPLYSV